MIESQLNSQAIQNDGEMFHQEGILQATIQNYSNGPIYFTWNNIERRVPPVDATLLIPAAPFVIRDFGNRFDLKITFRFPVGKANVIVDYSKPKQC